MASHSEDEEFIHDASDSTFCQYTDHQKINEGTFATVYKAECRRTEQPVALKVTPLRAGHNRRVPLDVAREVDLLLGLEHPNIIRLIDYFFEEFRKIYITNTFAFLANKPLKGGFFVMVLEYCEQDLYMRRVSGPISNAEKQSIMRQVLQGIEYCHR